MKAIIVTSVVDVDYDCFTVEAYFGTYNENGVFQWETHATADGKFKRIKVAGETHVLVQEFVMDDVGSLNPSHVDMTSVEDALDAYLAKRSA